MGLWSAEEWQLSCKLHYFENEIPTEKKYLQETCLFYYLSLIGVTRIASSHVAFGQGKAIKINQ